MLWEVTGPRTRSIVVVLKLNLIFSLRQPILTNVKTQERSKYGWLLAKEILGVVC